MIVDVGFRLGLLGGRQEDWRQMGRQGMKRRTWFCTGKLAMLERHTSGGDM